jgi:hypothetical protein
MKNKINRCYGKKSYETLDDVNLSGLLQMSNGAPQLYFYLCNYCNKWHLTKLKTDNRVF